MRFEKDNLQLPQVMCDGLDDWIECYHYTKKMKTYFEFVMSSIPKYNSGIHFEVHSVAIFNDFVSADTMKKLYHHYRNVGCNYFKDVKYGYDDYKYDSQLCKLFIIMKDDKYDLLFNTFGKCGLVCVDNVEEKQVKKLVFHLLCSHMYVYQFNETEGCDTIMTYNF